MSLKFQTDTRHWRTLMKAEKSVDLRKILEPNCQNLKNRSQINGYKLKNVRRESVRQFRKVRGINCKVNLMNLKQRIRTGVLEA
jgi:hypothetical protein